jgi:2-dehydro-3-deoxyphosphogluconate aldolase/(4S)-4-hydroxy-2-oxoglutarate aldolase
LPHLRIVPTGGVNLDTMEAFLAAGSAALGTGSALLKKEIIAGENWGELERLAKRFADNMAGLKAKLGR